MNKKLHVLGAGSAFNDMGLANSLHVIKNGEGLMLLDCGPTSLMQLKKYGYDTTRITHIYISHLHGDHFGGIPIILLEYAHVRQPTHKIKVISPLGFTEKLKAIMKELFPGSEKHITTFLEIKEVTDNDEYQDDMLHVKTLPAIHAEQPRMALIKYKDNPVIGYTGDSDLHEQSHKTLLKQADITLIECMTDTSKIPGHLSFTELRKITPETHEKPVLIIHASMELHMNKAKITKPFKLVHDGYEHEF